MEQSPLEQSLRLLRKNPEPRTVLYYSVLLGMIVWVVSINFMPAMQMQAMRKFHYTPRPFVQWAIWQFLPSMYNFHNEIFISPRLLTSDFQVPFAEDVLRLSVNHYPFRIIPYSLSRSQVFLRMPLYVYTRSKFRNRTLTSFYEVRLLGYSINVMFLNAYERSE